MWIGRDPCTPWRGVQKISRTIFLKRSGMENLFRSIGVTSLRPLWIHMDNAAPHRAKRTQNALQVIGISSLRHPPYSPDLAPSDFWLFGRIKQALGCSHFSNEAELKGAILDIIHKITTPEIRRVYNEWMRRLQACIDSEGEYVHLSQWSTTHTQNVTQRRSAISKKKRVFVGG